MQILFDERSDSFDLRNLNGIEMILICEALKRWYKKSGIEPSTPLMVTIESQHKAMWGALDRIVEDEPRREPEEH